jgi:signal transduction histidine kinase
VSIRFQLLLVALTTLILPWAGCQYARELETALRGSQEQALLASTGTIANALSATPDRAFRDSGTDVYQPAKGDIYAHELRNQPLLDGYRDDWGVNAPLLSVVVPHPDAATRPARLLAGVTERYLYLYVEVDQPHFHPEPANVNPQRDHFDRVELMLQEPGGAVESFFFATTAPGLIEAQSLVASDRGVDRAVSEPRIQAYWLQTSRGYHVEARVPRSLVGSHLWLAASGPPPIKSTPINPGTVSLNSMNSGSGSSDTNDSASIATPAITPKPTGVTSSGEMWDADGTDANLSGGRLFFAPAGLDELLATFIRAGTRATVMDLNGLKLAAAGTLDNSGMAESLASGRFWYRRFLEDSNRLAAPAGDGGTAAAVRHALAGHADTDWTPGVGADAILAAAAPIMVDGKTRGVVVLEQAGDQLVGLRDRALARLFKLTVLATGIAMACAFGFATWLGMRIRRLGAAADTAVTSEGTIRLDMPESRSADEIGALARSFERLLARLHEHTQYLRTLGGKLSHELRTPLTVVRSSLDNLESEGVSEDQRVYLARARAGSSRLQSILNALGAAARVEESFKNTERVVFDLRELLTATVAGYRDGFRSANFTLDSPPDSCPLRGAPDLLVQMLDKLVENAVDFCPPGGIIQITLERNPGVYRLVVANDGPPIAPAMLGRLFESLSEQRAGRDDKPHLGLGLYIVRLIAEFHGGQASAANRAAEAAGDGAAAATGVAFSVTLPMI